MSFTDEKWRAFEAYREMHKLRAVWSIYTIDNLDLMSGLSAAAVVYVDHWGPKPVRVLLKSGELTWGELFHAADAAIRQSGDDHHIYIENFRVEGTTLVLETGS